jgi:tRNA pseudouridine55 synthase
MVHAVPPLAESQSPQTTAEGILNVDKPLGMSSHDVVYRVRRITDQKRVGHAGTLDPLATGVLLVCLGQATRVSEYLMNGEKLYRARICLGVTTSTYDAEGDITAESEVSVSQDQAQDVLGHFRGKIQQVPPVYSAVKLDGRPLYKAARRGEQVTVPPRSIEVLAIDWVDWSPPHMTIDIRCSKGTYVRSLAHDIGQELGCGAHLAGLIRLASGSFRVEQAVQLDDLETIVRSGRLGQVLHPLDTALLAFPAVAVDELTAKRIVSGGTVALPAPADATMCRAYSTSGQVIALLRRTTEGWQPHKVFGQANYVGNS